MGQPNGVKSGVLHRTSILFNSKTFSDVEFHVKVAEAEEYKVFHAHKLILSMAGQGFARWFYEKSPDAKSIKIVDFTPHIFEMMLQYVYCDIINIPNLEDAMNLTKLAKKFMIYDLMDKCDAYISKFQVNIDTVFAKYESAMSYPHHPLLPICRRFVCENTRDVFESPNFCNASLLVVQDILKLDNLSVPNELKVVEAVIRWGQAKCKQKNRPPGAALCIRDAILPLLRHLRFLAMSTDEFFQFVEKYEILINRECTVLTAKLCKDDTPFPFPETLSPICTPRRGLHTFKNDNSQLAVSLRPLETNHSGALLPPTEASTTANHFRQTCPKQVSLPTGPTSSRYNLEEPTPPNTNGQPLYQIVPAKRNTPVLKVIPQAKTKTIRAYEFPLYEMQKEMASAFENDIKCNAAITMLRGIILIHGMELRVKDPKTSINELIEVHLCLSNKSTNYSNSHAIQLKNNTLELSLNEPYRVSPGNPLDIEVTIEDLKLNRCSVCRSEESIFELNCGLGIAAKISVNSNQSNGTDRFFFLISKLIYSVP